MDQVHVLPRAKDSSFLHTTGSSSYLEAQRHLGIHASSSLSTWISLTLTTFLSTALPVGYPSSFPLRLPGQLQASSPTSINNLPEVCATSFLSCVKFNPIYRIKQDCCPVCSNSSASVIELNDKISQKFQSQQESTFLFLAYNFFSIMEN